MDDYVRWLESREASAEWAWKALHDGLWWTLEPLEALDIIIEITRRLDRNEAALRQVGAGPLEDLLGADAPTLARAAEAARSSRPFRGAASNVDQKPGFDELRTVIDTLGT